MHGVAFGTYRAQGRYKDAAKIQEELLKKKRKRIMGEYRLDTRL